jgi:hypothetical protein
MIKEGRKLAGQESRKGCQLAHYGITICYNQIWALVRELGGNNRGS